MFVGTDLLSTLGVVLNSRNQMLKSYILIECLLEFVIDPVAVVLNSRIQRLV